jgi:CheY-like chemotaxis protein
MVMPGMSGPVLISQLRQLKSELKVIYISGYTEAAILQHNQLGLEPKASFIHKPFTPASLLNKIDQVLENED